MEAHGGYVRQKLQGDPVIGSSCLWVLPPRAQLVSDNVGEESPYASVGGAKGTTEMYQSILYLTSCKVYSKE